MRIHDELDESVDTLNRLIEYQGHLEAREIAEGVEETIKQLHKVLLHLKERSPTEIVD